MKFLPTEIPEVVLIEPTLHADGRGFLIEVYHAEKFRAGGIDVGFVQDNHSRSRGRTLRGLHAQLRHPQGKLVRAVRGEIFDVAVDIRPASATYKRFVSAHLSAENYRQLYVPPGFAHGFAVLSEEAEVEYKCTELYHPEDEITVAWNDPELAIPWPLQDPILSAKDREAPPLAELEPLLRRQGSTA